ncbi:MAG: hypothetical protein LBG43_01050 [Treponema sp.]|jgi:hypothetical protein|nr:hypothetical protein [Treponema sp.]
MANSTKAMTLQALRDKITSARILPMVIFTIKEWRENKDGVLEKVAAEGWTGDSGGGGGVY